jgi:hypothetical protein
MIDKLTRKGTLLAAATSYKSIVRHARTAAVLTVKQKVMYCEADHCKESSMNNTNSCGNWQPQASISRGTNFAANDADLFRLFPENESPVESGRIRPVPTVSRAVATRSRGGW